MRLLSSSTDGEGAVQMYVGNSGLDWTLFCPIGFDESDAEVLCRQFGYETGISLSFS